MNDIASALDAVTRLWLDPEHPHREETVQALRVSTGLNRRQIELALSNCFEELTESKITAHSVPLDRVYRNNVMHILPANAFTAWVHGAVLTLLAGYRCLLKPSGRESVFARAWKKSVDLTAPSLSPFVEIVPMEDRYLSECSAVAAYGADETLQNIRARLPAGKPFAGYGHKLSVGVIFEESADDVSLEKIRVNVVRDADPFRLQGCLSPQILYIQNPRITRWAALESSLDVAPKIRSFESWIDVAAQLEKFYPYLSCVGFAGSDDRQSYLEKELRAHEGLRVCRLGQMQRPPLSWRNGGIWLPDLLHSSRI